jgi:hypothetical protein
MFHLKTNCPGKFVDWFFELMDIVVAIVKLKMVHYYKFSIFDVDEKFKRT